jgi:hypothetical protein
MVWHTFLLLKHMQLQYFTSADQNCEDSIFWLLIINVIYFVESNLETSKNHIYRGHQAEWESSMSHTLPRQQLQQQQCYTKLVHFCQYLARTPKKSSTSTQNIISHIRVCGPLKWLKWPRSPLTLHALMCHALQSFFIDH